MSTKRLKRKTERKKERERDEGQVGLPQVTLLGAGWGTISDASLVFLARPRPLPFLLRAGADAVTAEPTPNHHIHTYLMIISHLLHRCGQTTSPGNQTLGEFHRPEVTSLWICDHNKKKKIIPTHLPSTEILVCSPSLSVNSCVHGLCFPSLWVLSPVTLTGRMQEWISLSRTTNDIN